jgi:glutamate racemase
VNEVIDNVLAPNGESNRCLINEVALDDVDRVSPRHVIEAVVVAHNHADAVATLKKFGHKATPDIAGSTRH